MLTGEAGGWAGERRELSALPTQFCCKPETACHAVPSHRVQLFATLWTAACQAPLSMGFSRQEWWIGLPFPPPKDLPDAGIEPEPLMSPALAGGFFTTSATWEAHLSGTFS